jgi:hypothetical protein
MSDEMLAEKSFQVTYDAQGRMLSFTDYRVTPCTATDYRVTPCTAIAYEGRDRLDAVGLHGREVDNDLGGENKPSGENGTQGEEGKGSRDDGTGTGTGDSTGT